MLGVLAICWRRLSYFLNMWKRITQDGRFRNSNCRQHSPEDFSLRWSNWSRGKGGQQTQASCSALLWCGSRNVVPGKLNAWSRLTRNRSRGIYWESASGHRITFVFNPPEWVWVEPLEISILCASSSPGKYHPTPRTFLALAIPTIPPELGLLSSGPGSFFFPVYLNEIFIIDISLSLF